MERHHESEHMREIPLEILQDILLRLPTKDVIRSSSVSKLWRRIVRDPSFGKLHAADHALTPSESEDFLVSVNREPGRHDEASFFNVSSGMAMCHVAIPSGYSLANICNDFGPVRPVESRQILAYFLSQITIESAKICLLFNRPNMTFVCFALDAYDQVPVVVCNPITGETLELPKAPLLSVSEENGGHALLSHRFVLGFSPPTQEYKMFRLSFRNQYYSQGYVTNYIAVYTLGSRRGWHQYSYVSRFFPLLHALLPPPVHIDGNLYIPVETGHTYNPEERAARMLVLNVATETRCMYRLPYNYCHHGYHESWEMLADGFELNGQMCLAVNVFDEGPRRKLQFWVMKPPGELGGKDDDDKLHWDLRYCFDLSGESFIFQFPTRGAWLDHDKMLCYRHGDFLFKHDTGGYSLSSNDGLLLFDQKLELPRAPLASSSSSQSASLSSCRWNICGGYRPSLLSPLAFALPPSQDEKGKNRLFEHTLLRAVRQSNKTSCC